jgi:serine/threonine protein kinase
LIAPLPEALSVALTGRYSIERPLGSGGMATVYLARDLRHARDVALKVLAPGLAVTIGAGRFRREIRLAAGLHHPNILSVLDSGEDGGFFWYTMPFVDGTSLQQHIRNCGRLTLTEALQYALEAADALAYAHQKGVIHRDIKPANLLLANGHLFVADFGVATPAGSELGDKLTSTGFVVGTPDYMSPEQASGAAYVDGRTDQFSLAAALGRERGPAAAGARGNRRRLPGAA